MYRYATKTYIMHFLEAARFLNALIVAGRKVNLHYDPGLAARLPPTTAVTAVIICIKLPMNLFFIWRFPLLILMRGKDITWAIGRVGS